MIEVREGRRSPYRVRRLEGKLSASFRIKAAAELQDALWRRWGDQNPVLVDQEPKIPPALEARLLSPGRREVSTVLLAELLAAHPARSATRAPAKEDEPLLGEYIVDFFPKWARERSSAWGLGHAEGAQDDRHRPRRTPSDRLRDAVEARRARLAGPRRGGTGHRPRMGQHRRSVDPAPRLRHGARTCSGREGRGRGDRQRDLAEVRSFLKQLIDYAKLRNDYPRERQPGHACARASPDGRAARSEPYLPEIVERSGRLPRARGSLSGRRSPSKGKER